MSLFGRSGPSPEEWARENQIKRNITEELSKALKTLQREHVNSDEPIYSEDSANAVCNVLEAVFLHGLKGSITHKLSYYVVWSLGDPEPCVTFWGLLTKFTHRDVVSQLNHLGQITTETGMCRAWVRMALNDGVLESYLNAMLTDKSSLRSYYKRTAYLRDEEQAEILKTYVQGVASFRFQLSYNSSVLNIWTTSPLVLAGHMAQQFTPAAVVSSRSDGALSEHTVASNTESQDTSNVVVSSSRKHHHHHKNSRSGVKIPSSVSYDERLSSKLIPQPPPNTPYDHAQLTKTDIEEIRKMTLKNAASDASSSTEASHISCPDPSDNFTVQPQEGATMSSVHEVDGKVGYTKMNCKEDSSGGLGMSVDPVEPDVVSGADTNSGPAPGANKKDRSPSPRVQHCQEKGQTKDYAFSTVSSPPESQDQESIPQSTVMDTDTTTHGASELASKPPSILPFNANRQKSEPLMPVLSPVTASAVEVGEEATRDHDNDMTDEGMLHDDVRADGEGILEDGEEVITSESNAEVTASYRGNQLGMMRGWSSEFEHPAAGGGGGEMEESIIGELVKRNNSVQDSFNNLLQTYDARQEGGLVGMPSMSQVLNDLPDLHSNSSQKQELSTSGENSSTVSGDFEILPCTLTVSPTQSDQRTQTLLAIIGDICNEKGLDQQNYQCAGCSRPVGMIYGKARVCMYDGMYYCYECHENEEYYIPSRIVHNWDFRKHKVAKHTMRFLKQTEEHSLIHIHRSNPRLYEHVPEMEEIRLLRLQLHYLRAYLFTCKQCVADDLRKRVWPKEYLYDDIHSYSLSDLLQVQSGQFAQSIKKIIKYASKHVYDCRLCSQKGFICELCDSPKVIYPFEMEGTVQCDVCSALYHRECKTSLRSCLKCERRLQRKMQSGNQLTTPDSVDYAYAPEEPSSGATSEPV